MRINPPGVVTITSIYPAGVGTIMAIHPPLVGTRHQHTKEKPLILLSLPGRVSLISSPNYLTRKIFLLFDKQFMKGAFCFF